jgi:hypothetical protein
MMNMMAMMIRKGMERHGTGGGVEQINRIIIA